MAQLIKVRAEYVGGGWSEIGIVLPDESAGRHVHAETVRKLRERFGDVREVAEVRVKERWPTALRPYT